MRTAKDRPKFRKTSVRAGADKEIYLLTWNPNSPNDFDFEESAKKTAAGNTFDSNWSCGNTQKIRKGFRVFLVRLALEPKGIVASGFVTTKEPYPGDHWNKQKRAEGIKALYIDVQWDKVIDSKVDEPLSISALPKWKQRQKGWTPQRSGIEIPIHLAEKLEKLWSAHIGISNVGNNFVDDEMAAFEGQERTAFVRHRRREQRLREAKLKQYRKQNKGRLFCEVPRCGFDFESIYGESGRNYAQVHHLKPLADTTAPTQTRLGDLAVVCANCHAIIHRGGKCRPLKKLIP